MLAAKQSVFSLIIGNTKAQREHHTLVGPVSLTLARAFLTKAKSRAVLQFNTYVVIEKIKQCAKRSQ